MKLKIVAAALVLLAPLGEIYGATPHERIGHDDERSRERVTYKLGERPSWNGIPKDLSREINNPENLLISHMFVRDTNREFHQLTAFFRESASFIRYFLPSQLHPTRQHPPLPISGANIALMYLMYSAAVSHMPPDSLGVTQPVLKRIVLLHLRDMLKVKKNKTAVVIFQLMDKFLSKVPTDPLEAKQYFLPPIVRTCFSGAERRAIQGLPKHIRLHQILAASRVVHCGRPSTIIYLPSFVETFIEHPLTLPDIVELPEEES